jgi:hypothetical protein
MKLKSAEVKGKLFDYIVNPTGSNAVERHVSSADKLGKRYRNMAPVFSIDEEDGGKLLWFLCFSKGNEDTLTNCLHQHVIFLSYIFKHMFF